MTATDDVGEEVPRSPDDLRRRLGPGASPRAIADALLPDDRERFLVEYDRLVDAARTSLDLTEVLEMLEAWRPVAALQADPARFGRTVRRVAELVTGERSPEDDEFEVTRAKAGM